jgi:hypothetical protein
MNKFIGDKKFYKVVLMVVYHWICAGKKRGLVRKYYYGMIFNKYRIFIVYIRFVKYGGDYDRHYVTATPITYLRMQYAILRYNALIPKQIEDIR